MSRRQAFVVTLPVVKGISRRQFAGYIRDAVSQWAGQFEPPGGSALNSPGDPLFTAIYQNQRTVRVRPVRRAT